MKTVLFDLFSAQPAEGSKFHGGGEYIKAVFKYLAENCTEKCNLIVFYNKDAFIDEWIKEIISQKNIKNYDIKSLRSVQQIFLNEKVDVLYSGIPYYFKREWIPDDVSFKGTIHGLRQLELPTDKYAPLYHSGKKKVKEIIKILIINYVRHVKYMDFKRIISMLDEIITVSNHSLYALKFFFPDISHKSISMYYTPSKEFKFSDATVAVEDFPYILMIGGNRWEKNCYRMILAIEKLFSQGYINEYKIVVIGKLSKKIKHAIHHPDRFILKDYVEMDELERLYKFCDVFFYCSLNEGFGMPPLEAMKYGKTCIVSGVCSLPEVCGDAAYIVNPYDINEISSRLLNAVDVKKDELYVRNRFEHINNMQKNDLEMLCNDIIS